MVDVSNKQNSVVIKVTASNANTNVTASSDTAQYWSNTSRKYSEEAKMSAHQAEQAKNEVITQKDSVISEINTSKDTALTEINQRFEQGIGDGINQITVLVDDSIAEYTEISNEIKQSNSQASKLARDWATSEVLVDNIDYSAKYYAEKAKDNSGIFYDELTDEDIDVEILDVNYATKSELELGLNTKQDKGDYALASDIPDLTGYVKNTDYATDSKVGVIKGSGSTGLYCNSSGNLVCSTASLSAYQSKPITYTIGKGTLENIKNNYVKEAITANATELTADEKASAKQWLGYADNTDIMQAIASIPQFSLSIVEALPTTGAKMTLYLVPKEGTNNDVYDEYIWIEQTSSFEHLGTTAVDLTDYIKNTDYAGATTAGSAGIVKCSSTFACGCTNGYIQALNIPTLERYNNLSQYAFIGKATLQTALTQYSKTVLTTEADYDALATKDANTLYLIEE